MKKRKIILTAVAAIIIGLVGWQIYQRALKPSQGPGIRSQAAPVAVEITAVKTKTIRDYGNFTGTLVPKSQFMIAPKISGRLEKLMN